LRDLERYNDLTDVAKRVPSVLIFSIGNSGAGRSFRVRNRKALSGIGVALTHQRLLTSLRNCAFHAKHVNPPRS
jgi:hypothetical protein